jgi:uncharacterized protein YicC (UPF0701 family)
VIAGQLDQIARLTTAARGRARPRDSRRQADATLREGWPGPCRARPVDETRLAQELALLAVKTDVTEELDRLAAHVAAARALLAEAARWAASSIS